MSNRDSNSRVFLGRLPPNTRERDIERFFRGFGRIREINLKAGFAFVEFEERKDADDAVYELNHMDLLGERITVEHAHPSERNSYGGGSRGYGGGGGSAGRRGSRFRDKYGPPYNTEFRMVVENLSTRASWQDLKDYMRQAGEVTFAKCHKERVGEGVVEFASYDDMKRALKRLDGTELLGKKIRLLECASNKHRSRSRSPRRRSSRRRTRSRSRSPKTRRSRSPKRSASRSPRRSRSPSLAERNSKSPEPNKSPAQEDGNSPARSRSPSPVKDDDKD